MTNKELLSSQINDAVKAAIAQAIERHRLLGESIAVWRDGKVVVLQANQIPPLQLDRPLPQNDE